MWMRCQTTLNKLNMGQDESILASLDKQMKELGIEAEPLEGDLPAAAVDDVIVEPAVAPKTEETKVEPEKVEPVVEKTEPPQERSPRVDAFKHRESKRREELEGLKSEISELKDLVKGFVTAKNPDEKAEAKDELEVFAEKYGTDVNSIKELSDILMAKFKKDNPDKPALDDKQKEAIELAHFNTEFDEFTSSIFEEYPNASAKQVAEAKKLMQDLAFQKGNNLKPLDEIYALKKKDFEDVLFSPRRKTGESGKLGDVKESEPEDLESIEINSVSSALKAQKLLSKMAQAEEKTIIYRNGEAVDA